jgi:hypothetical protein
MRKIASRYPERKPDTTHGIRLVLPSGVVITLRGDGAAVAMSALNLPFVAAMIGGGR